MAQVDYFLKIPGVDGESQDATHKGEIDIRSWSFGANNASTARSGGGLGAGKVNVQPLHVVLPINKASPKLLLACCTGQHFADAVLTCRKAGTTQQEYYKIKLTDMMITSYQSGGSNETMTTDQVSLDFAKFEVEYKEQKVDGSLGPPVKAGYDIKANKTI